MQQSRPRMWQQFLRCMMIVVGWLGSSSQLAYAQTDAAQPGPSTATALHWVRLGGSYDCIDGQALASSVEAKLRRPIFAAPSTFPLLIEGYVERDEQGYRSLLRMTALDGTLLGTRALTSGASDCRELSETVSVVLAVMIDPEASIQTTPPVAPKPEIARVPAAASAARDEPDQLLLTFVRGGVALMPGLALGIGAAYERQLSSWGGLRVEGVGFLERRAESKPATDPPSGVRLRLAYAGGAYCPLWLATTALRIAGCVGLELGVRNAEGYGFGSGDRAAVAPWASATARVGVSVRLVSVLTAQLGAGLFVPFAPERYQAKQADGRPVDVYRQPPAGGAFDIALGARF